MPATDSHGASAAYARDFWRPGTKSHSTNQTRRAWNIPREPSSTARRQQLWCSTVTFRYRPGVPVIQDYRLRCGGHGRRAHRLTSGSNESTLATLLARFPRYRARCDTRWWTGYSITGRGLSCTPLDRHVLRGPACAWHRRRKHRAGGAGCRRTVQVAARGANPRPGASAAGRLMPCSE